MRSPQKKITFPANPNIVRIASSPGRSGRQRHPPAEIPLRGATLKIALAGLHAGKRRMIFNGGMSHSILQ